MGYKYRSKQLGCTVLGYLSTEYHLQSQQPHVRVGHPTTAYPHAHGSNAVILYEQPPEIEPINLGSILASQISYLTQGPSTQPRYWSGSFIIPVVS